MKMTSALNPRGEAKGKVWVRDERELTSIDFFPWN